MINNVCKNRQKNLTKGVHRWKNLKFSHKNAADSRLSTQTKQNKILKMKAQRKWNQEKIHTGVQGVTSGRKGSKRAKRAKKAFLDHVID